MKKLFLLLLLFGLSATMLSAQEKPVVILLMRHAEKATTGGADPNLSEKGKGFAAMLSTHFAELKVDAVYSTNYKRTIQTVTPLAVKNGVEVKVYDAGKSAELVKRIADSQAQVVVVSGHSNTINLVFNELVKSTQIQALSDEEYGKVFVIYYNKANPANSAFVKLSL